jgi:hypothetical protein
MKLIFIILFIQLLTACSDNQHSKKSNAVINIPNKEKEIKIDTFSTFPPEIDGCACYFSNNEEEFKDKKYIYADDYGDNAFISVNGKMTKFVLNKSTKLNNTRYVQTFVNDDYEITIDLKQVSQLDETWQKTGTLKIKPKVGKVIVKNIYGECGC